MIRLPLMRVWVGSHQVKPPPPALLSLKFKSRSNNSMSNRLLNQSSQLLQLLILWSLIWLPVAKTLNACIPKPQKCHYARLVTAPSAPLVSCRPRSQRLMPTALSSWQPSSSPLCVLSTRSTPTPKATSQSTNLPRLTSVRPQLSSGSDGSKSWTRGSPRKELNTSGRCSRQGVKRWQRRLLRLMRKRWLWGTQSGYEILTGNASRWWVSWIGTVKVDNSSLI